MRHVKDIADLGKARDEILKGRDPDERVVAVCCGTGCIACGGLKVAEAFQDHIEFRGLSSKVRVLRTGCHGFCERGPLVVIQPAGTLYQQVKPNDIPEIVENSIEADRLVERLLYVDSASGDKIVREEDVPFYKHQTRLVLGMNGALDPTNLKDYVAIGGYGSLAKALGSMTPDEIVAAVKSSGLRGRGGGGFPTGKKWESCLRAPGDVRYLICNADEGDPGAYMDRSILEGNPHSVLEGMVIGAFALGVRDGYIYVREEYPLAVANFTKALGDARSAGLLGENILGSGFSFDVSVARGGGAFVCGESTALMASIEGRPGEPRPKHIHTVESGLRKRPTVLNNVETWANVPLIVDRGADWYGKIGTEGRKGTKIFSLVGKVNNTGLVEVPMGVTLRTIVDDIGGGIRGGRSFKAVQTGGPSGGCIPVDLLDLPVDFDRLTEAGSMMGSGGMIVMDDRNCMVDIAKYFVGFLKNESCGKCTPCREGLRQMHAILTDICDGRGEERHLDELEYISWGLEQTALCQLGSTAQNPVLTTLRYFRDEYDAHIREKRCPAGICKALITYSVVADACTGCTVCARKCPSDAITGEPKKVHEIVQDKCIKCGICYEACKFDAIAIE
jgi:NADH-quinone oxidoreductase subunit F